jgi:hypothetical protein
LEQTRRRLSGATPGLRHWGARSPGTNLLKTSRIAREQSQKVAHGHADCLLSRFIFLEGAWSASKQLAGLSLAEMNLLAHGRDLGWSIFLAHVPAPVC